MRLDLLNSMWQLGATVVVLALLSLGVVTLFDSSPPDERQYTDDPLSFVQFYYSRCIDAHRQIGSSHWSLVGQHYAGLGDYGTQYQVILAKTSEEPFLRLSIVVDKVFPDAPRLSCIFDGERQQALSVELGGEDEVWLDAPDAIEPRESIDFAFAGVSNWQLFRYSLNRVAGTSNDDPFAEMVLTEPASSGRDVGAVFAHCDYPISGVISDSSSQPVEDATVEIMTTAFGADQTLRTNELGQFEFHMHVICSALDASPVVRIFKSGYQPYIGGPADDGTVVVTLLRLNE